MRNFLTTAVLAAAMALPAIAQTTDPGVADTSFSEASGHRVLQFSALIPAPPREVWSAVTTAEGWRRLGVRSAVVDFRVGGMIETNYKPDVPVGDRSNIKNQIVAYVPERVLVIRNVQAPPGFPHAAEFAETATVFELDAAGPSATRLTLTGVGFRSGPAFDALHTMFAVGNAYTLEILRKSFVPVEPGPD